jgi:hypothetical protein
MFDSDIRIANLYIVWDGNLPLDLAKPRSYVFGHREPIGADKAQEGFHGNIGVGSRLGEICLLAPVDDVVE